MPSYRAILPIGDVHPGKGPEAVMDSAVAAVSSIATVEHTDIPDSCRCPQIVVRFHLDDDGDAPSSPMRCKIPYRGSPLANCAAIVVASGWTLDHLSLTLIMLVRGRKR